MLSGKGLRCINRDKSLEQSDNLPDSDVLAQEILEDLRNRLEPFCEIAES